MEKEFKVFCLTSFNEDSKCYKHWSHGLSMYIKKDGITIKLNSDEIQQLVRSLPKTIGGKY